MSARTKKLDDFDIESDRLSKAKSDEIKIKCNDNQQIKLEIVGVVVKLTDLRDQCSVFDTKVMNDIRLRFYKDKPNWMSS